MHERRVFTTADKLEYGSEVELAPEDSRHLIKVLRLQEGTPLTLVSSPAGEEFNAVICDLSARQVKVRVIGRGNSRQAKSRVGTLIFALAKGSKNDLVCEKACELGAQSIIFWQAQHSVLRLNERDGAHKLDRWRKITEAAAKQCGSTAIPQVSLALTIDSLLRQLSDLSQPDDARLVCSLSPEAKELRTLPAPSGKAHVAIGPEGDFSSLEERALIEAGFQPMTLGPLTLRCETAAIAALAAIHAAWGFLK